MEFLERLEQGRSGFSPEKTEFKFYAAEKKVKS